MIEQHEQKVNKIVNHKLDFKKPKAFKRQNSFKPMLEPFGDIDDHDQV